MRVRSLRIMVSDRRSANHLACIAITRKAGLKVTKRVLAPAQAMVSLSAIHRVDGLYPPARTEVLCQFSVPHRQKRFQ